MCFPLPLHRGLDWDSGKWQTREKKYQTLILGLKKITESKWLLWDSNSPDKSSLFRRREPGGSSVSRETLKRMEEASARERRERESQAEPGRKGGNVIFRYKEVEEWQHEMMGKFRWGKVCRSSVVLCTDVCCFSSYWEKPQTSIFLGMTSVVSYII